MERTALAAISCDGQSGTYARMESLFSSAGTTFAWILHLPPRAIPPDGIRQRQNSARRDNLVSAWSVACRLLALVVRRDSSSYSHARSPSHPRIVRRATFIGYAAINVKSVEGKLTWLKAASTIPEHLLCSRYPGQVNSDRLTDFQSTVSRFCSQWERRSLNRTKPTRPDGTKDAANNRYEGRRRS